VTKPAFSTSIFQYHNVYQLLFITCHGVSLVFSSALLYVNRFKLHAFPSHFHKRPALKWNYKCVTFSSYHSLLLKQHLFIIKVGNLCIETKPEALKRSYLESVHKICGNHTTCTSMCWHILVVDFLAEFKKNPIAPKIWLTFRLAIFCRDNFWLNCSRL